MAEALNEFQRKYKLASEMEELEEARAAEEADHNDEVQRLLNPLNTQWRASEIPNLREGSPELPKNGDSACRMLESSIKDSYYKANRTVALQRQSNSEVRLVTRDISCLGFRPRLRVAQIIFAGLSANLPRLVGAKGGISWLDGVVRGSGRGFEVKIK